MGLVGVGTPSGPQHEVYIANVRTIPEQVLAVSTEFSSGDSNKEVRGGGAV